MASVDMSVIKNLQELGKDKNFLPDLVNVFTKDIPVILADLQQSLKAKDAKAMASAAHKYKSSSRQLGAAKLSDLCLQVEKAAKEDQHTSKAVAEAIEKIKTESNIVIKELKVIVENYKKGK